MIAEVKLAGEAVRLLPEFALYWVRSKTVIIADLHLGKSSSLRAESVPVPVGTTSKDLERIDSVLTRTGAERLLVLGDVLHSRTSLTGALQEQLATWRSSWSNVTMAVVRGNHDRRAGELPSKLAVSYYDGPLYEPPFVFTHYPETYDNLYNLAGHLHPAVKLTGPARQSARLPCFLLGQKRGVLPAFGGLTGKLTIRPSVGERVYVVADNQVLEVPLLPEVNSPDNRGSVQ